MTLDKFPISFYDSDGDCLEVCLRSGPYVTEQIDQTLMLHIDRETHDVIGYTLMGVSQIER